MFYHHDIQDQGKKQKQKCDIEGRFYLPHNPQAARLVERKNETLKQQIKLLTSKSTLTGWN